MLDFNHEYKPHYLLYLQVENGDQHSVRGAQLLLAGTILQQYCTASEEEEDESDDRAGVIDVRHLTSLGSILLTICPGTTGDR